MSAFYKSEKCFRRYEYAIQRAVEVFPKEISFMPEGGRAVTTETARCRDAITSWLKERWPTEARLDPTKVAELMVYTTGDGTVKIAGREIVKAQRVSRVERISNVQVTEDVEAEAHMQTSLIDHVEELVAEIDEGRREGQIVFPHSSENLSRIIAAVGARLNVAYYVKEDKIIVF